MRVLGNILWIILGGLAIAIGWALVGLILCISIIGIPFGLQAFKMAGLTLTPFGKTVQYGGGAGSALANILWVVLVGWWMALGYLGAGVLNCITIIGIPFGLQSFKMAKLALWPFGAENRQPVDSKYYKAAKATLDEAVTDVNNWIDQQAAKAE